MTALVGDLDLGRPLLAEITPEDRGSLRATYGFAPPAGELLGAVTGPYAVHAPGR